MRIFNICFLTFLLSITIVHSETEFGTQQSTSIKSTITPASSSNTQQLTNLNTNWETQAQTQAGSAWPQTEVLASQQTQIADEQVSLEVDNNEFHKWMLMDTAGEVPVVKPEDAAKGATDITEVQDYETAYESTTTVDYDAISGDTTIQAVITTQSGDEKVGTTGIVIKLSTTNQVSVEVLPPLVSQQIQVRGRIIQGAPGDKPTVSLVILKGKYLSSAASTTTADDFVANQQIFSQYKFNAVASEPVDNDIMFAFSYDPDAEAPAAANNFGILSYINSKLFGTSAVSTSTSASDAELAHFQTQATGCKSIEGCIVRCVGRQSAAEEWSTRAVYTGTSTRGTKVITKCVTTTNGFLTVMKYRRQIGSNDPVVITFQLSESSRLLMNSQFARQYLKTEIVELLYGINPDQILILTVTDPGVVTFSISPSGISGDTRTNTWAEFFESLMLSDTVEEGKYLYQVTNVLQACGDGEFIDASNLCGSAAASTTSSDDSFLVPGGVILIVIFGTILCGLFALFVVWVKRREAAKQAGDAPNSV